MVIKSPLSMQRCRKKGFTLTEIAIVLGIIGLILGSIWVAASSVYSNVKTANAQRTILATAQAVRSMYVASNGSTGVTAATLITAPGMLPLDYVNSSWYVNPWNLTASASVTYVYGSGTVFTVQYDNIPSSACVSLVNSFSNAASATTGNGNIAGLIGSIANSTAATAGTASITTVPASGTSTYATVANCGTATTNSSNIAIAFDMSKM